jgi:hypothetical protein
MVLLVRLVNENSVMLPLYHVECSYPFVRAGTKTAVNTVYVYGFMLCMIQHFMLIVNTKRICSTNNHPEVDNTKMFLNFLLILTTKA